MTSEPGAASAAQWTMEELLERVRDALPRLVKIDQPRYKVTDVPDARTVRYYIAQGLVDQPTGRRGTFALYERKHLLQVLAVKLLQAEYLPIRKIQALLAGLDEPGLEKVLGDAKPGPEGAEPRRRSPDVAGAKSPVTATDWQRYPLHPGLELHVARGVQLTPDELDLVSNLIRNLLERPNR